MGRLEGGEVEMRVFILPLGLRLNTPLAGCQNRMTKSYEIILRRILDATGFVIYACESRLYWLTTRLAFLTNPRQPGFVSPSENGDIRPNESDLNVVTGSWYPASTKNDVPGPKTFLTYFKRLKSYTGFTSAPPHLRHAGRDTLGK